MSDEHTEIARLRQNKADFETLLNKYTEQVQSYTEDMRACEVNFKNLSTLEKFRRGDKYTAAARALQSAKSALEEAVEQRDIAINSLRQIDEEIGELLGGVVERTQSVSAYVRSESEKNWGDWGLQLKEAQVKHQAKQELCARLKEELEASKRLLEDVSSKIETTKTYIATNQKILDKVFGTDTYSIQVKLDEYTRQVESYNTRSFFGRVTDWFRGLFNISTPKEIAEQSVRSLQTTLAKEMDEARGQRGRLNALLKSLEKTQAEHIEKQQELETEIARANPEALEKDIMMLKDQLAISFDDKKVDWIARCRVDVAQRTEGLMKSEVRASNQIKSALQGFLESPTQDKLALLKTTFEKNSAAKTDIRLMKLLREVAQEYSDVDAFLPKDTFLLIPLDKELMYLKAERDENHEKLAQYIEQKETLEEALQLHTTQQTPIQENYINLNLEALKRLYHLRGLLKASTRNSENELQQKLIPEIRKAIVERVVQKQLSAEGLDNPRDEARYKALYKEQMKVANALDNITEHPEIKPLESESLNTAITEQLGREEALDYCERKIEQVEAGLPQAIVSRVHEQLEGFDVSNPLESYFVLNTDVCQAEMEEILRQYTSNEKLLQSPLTIKKLHMLKEQLGPDGYKEVYGKLMQKLQQYLPQGHLESYPADSKALHSADKYRCVNLDRELDEAFESLRSHYPGGKERFYVVQSAIHTALDEAAEALYRINENGHKVYLKAHDYPYAAPESRKAYRKSLRETWEAAIQALQEAKIDVQLQAYQSLLQHYEHLLRNEGVEQVVSISMTENFLDHIDLSTTRAVNEALASYFKKAPDVHEFFDLSVGVTAYLEQALVQSHPVDTPKEAAQAIAQSIENDILDKINNFNERRKFSTAQHREMRVDANIVDALTPIFEQYVVPKLEQFVEQVKLSPEKKAGAEALALMVYDERNSLRTVQQAIKEEEKVAQQMAHYTAYIAQTNHSTPDYLPQTLVKLIDDCGQVRSSILNSAVRVALKDFLSYPTQTHLDALEMSIAKDEQCLKNKKLSELFERAGEFYPQVQALHQKALERVEISPVLSDTASKTPESTPMKDRAEKTAGIRKVLDSFRPKSEASDEADNALDETTTPNSKPSR